MRARPVSLVALVAVLASVLSVGLSGIGAAAPAPAASSAVTGNVSGPTVLAFNGSHTYSINASGGPAFAANGSLVGNLTYYASVTGSNLTGDTINPGTGVFTTGQALDANVTVGDVGETLTIDVEITSVYQTANVSLNLTYSLTVVQPYVLTLNLVANSSTTGVAAFSLAVQLDGTPVGTIQVPAMSPGQTRTVSFEYATLGLSAGDHTFSVSLANEHGLVTFAGGSTVYTTSFYVAGAPPSYTVWYVAGAVAFFGAIFIFVTRVAARRRTPSRK